MLILTPLKIFGGAVTFFEVVEEEQIFGCCWCAQNLGVGEAKPLCEVGSLGLAVYLGRGCGCGCLGCGCGFGCLQPSFLAQSWLGAVEMGHRWSLVGRDLGQAGGKDIGVWVAWRCEMFTRVSLKNVY